MGKCEQCIIREFGSLKMLSKDELLTLSYCKSSHALKKGEALFDEGENVKGIYCIKNGVCKLTKRSTNGKDQIIKLVSKGELLGQRSLISEESVNLSAVALEDTEVCFMPRQDVIKLFNENNKFSMDIMKTICHSLKKSDNFAIDMAQKNVKGRLAQTLLSLYETFGVNPDKTLKIQLSREELASMIGAATESCIRLLSDFNNDGIIELIGKKIILKDVSKLKKLTK